MRRQYPFHLIEPRWQNFWQTRETFRAANPGEPGSEKPKYYVLDMFPYPSGAGLHVGHPEGYTATDIIARFKRMNGFNVLHPMGWDAFGLPAEQHAIQTGTHPRVTTQKNIATFKRQIQALGFSYDWSREIDTTDPKYYKWTQWIFLQLYKKGLAYVSDAPVWYCPALGTVLANEEVLNTPEGPRSERGNHAVERRPLRQWMLKITAYAERLLKDLDLLDWPESLKEMQRNWIGKSEGAEVHFMLEGSREKLTVFTTRPDTLFGATYMVLSPEHPLVTQITSAQQKAEVESYRQKVANKTDLERTDLAKDKTGVFTGAYAINPVNQEKIPIWIADYVLMGYGTGAIMAVPAHDERDYEFARKFNLRIVEVVQPSQPVQGCFSGDGTSINSAFLSGLPTPEAKKRISQWLEEKNLGRKTVNYKLRDWLFSRQRYWGEPFPILWKNEQHSPIPEKELPLILPELDDFKPTPDGVAPLNKAREWVNLPDGSAREINTMPQWAGSCWYYLRYCDPRNEQQFISPAVEKYWLGNHGVDLYIGGAEHAVLHLLYARFWHKVLFDLGQVSTPEPFRKLVNQGLILGEDNQKMSKSIGNVINPDDVIRDYGADALRLFEMFMGPLEQVKPWSTKGVEGVYRFLGRVWRLFVDEKSEQDFEQKLTMSGDAPESRELLKLVALAESIQETEPTREQLHVLHLAIRKVTEDIQDLRMNTAISALMVFVNEAMKWERKPKSLMNQFVLLLSPFAPHLAEELWNKLGHSDSLAYVPWPKHDENLLATSEVEIIVQVNGKVRDKFTVAKGVSQKDLESRALTSEKVQSQMQGKQVRKIIVVPDKLVNIVVG